ncbi:MAG: formylglycine-generating enzyme family protein [Gammaproteobacteria bacterium]|nr:formylglycine-generating enzyme family protein [Gammaproteobacteria bacterium]MBU1656343.1 formylglycine-generating enzyme family protein [Gammaproteobacteria bacterium]
MTAPVTPPQPPAESVEAAKVGQPGKSPGPGAEAVAKPEEPKAIRDEKTGQVLISLLGGRFSMGNRSGISADEAPAHEVVLKPFLIGEKEVTFREYDRFAQASGRPLPKDEGWGRDDRPVINVSWEDAKAFTDWLSAETGQKYRLPTEAEWEYAASGGGDAFYWWGYQKGLNNANCFNCGSEWDGRSTAPVGSFKPNPYGLYNTAGNVQEWVGDCYKSSYLNAPTDGSAVDFKGCGERVARGGAYNKPAASMRNTKRSRFVKGTAISSLGFRVARDP